MHRTIRLPNFYEKTALLDSLTHGGVRGRENLFNFPSYSIWQIQWKTPTVCLNVWLRFLPDRDGVGHFLPIYKKFYNLPIIYMEEYDEDLLEIITENADNRK